MTAAVEVTERGRLGRLGIPSAALVEWRTLALAIAVHGPASCEGAVLPADAWWSGHEEDNELARQACNLCAVRPQCLAYAQAAGEREGVWGGLTPAERAR